MTRIAGPSERHFRAWLDAELPAFNASLVKLWGAQAQELTAASISSAAELPEPLRDAWDRAYAQWVEDVLMPSVVKTLTHIHEERGGGVAAVAGRRPRFPAFKEAVTAAAEARAGSLIKGLSASQAAAFNRVLTAGLAEGLAPRSLAALLRPIVPLDDRSARAVLARRAALQRAGLKPDKVDAGAERYAKQLQGVRAVRIARTELAEAFHSADHALMEASVAEGLLVDTVRVWETADDERTCKLCAPLDGVRVTGLSEPFPSGASTRLHPPLHPACRCTVIYEARPAPPRRPA